jgi:hypothetical protein
MEFVTGLLATITLRPFVPICNIGFVITYDYCVCLSMFRNIKYFCRQWRREENWKRRTRDVKLMNRIIISIVIILWSSVLTTTTLMMMARAQHAKKIFSEKLLMRMGYKLQK